VGIDAPILPGLLPIVSASQIMRIAELSGATIPEDLRSKLERHAEDDRATRAVGIEHTTNQVRELWGAGVEGIHFYVLNRSYSVAKILTNTGLSGR
jgi:methylenetetrahydrofolate reductase (NADPH)